MRIGWTRPACVTGLLLAILVWGVAAFGASVPLTSQNLTVFETCTLTPSTAASTVGADAGVNQLTAGSNLGGANGMSVSPAMLNIVRDYIRFDLTRCIPAIPSTATVTGATLRLYASQTPLLSCRTHDIFRVTSSWTESTITWNNQPFGTTANNPPTAQRTTSLTIGSGTCQNTAAGYVSGWDVTADVAAFVAGGTNNGWMIRDDSENSGLSTSAATYSTKETNNAAAGPQLIVTYKL